MLDDIEKLLRRRMVELLVEFLELGTREEYGRSQVHVNERVSAFRTTRFNEPLVDVHFVPVVISVCDALGKSAKAGVGHESFTVQNIHSEQCRNIQVNNFKSTMMGRAFEGVATGIDICLRESTETSPNRSESVDRRTCLFGVPATARASVIALNPKTERGAPISRQNPGMRDSLRMLESSSTGALTTYMADSQSCLSHVKGGRC